MCEIWDQRWIQHFPEDTGSWWRTLKNSQSLANFSFSSKIGETLGWHTPLLRLAVSDLDNPRFATAYDYQEKAMAKSQALRNYKSQQGTGVPLTV